MAPNYMLPQNALRLDFSPVQRGIQQYANGMNQEHRAVTNALNRQSDMDWRQSQAERAQGNADRSFEANQTHRASQLGLQNRQFNALSGYRDRTFEAGQANADRAFDLRQKTFGMDTETHEENLKQNVIKRGGGVAQLIDREQDPTKKAEMWRQFVNSNPLVLSSLPAQYHNDPVAGSQYIMAQARGYQDPVSQRLKSSTILKNEAEATGFGKPPTGYRFNQDGTLTAIPGGPATKMGSDVAGKVALMANGLLELPRAQKIFDDIGLGGRANMVLNRGHAGEARRIVQTLVEAQLRALTGAAATPQETDRLMNFYGPVSSDTVETMKAKLARLDRTVRNSIKLMQTGRVTYDNGNRLDALIPAADLSQQPGATTAGSGQGGTGNLPVMTPQQAQSLPPGTQFTTTDGRIMRVPGGTQ